ncbi:MAG: GNAT family N-acetyltransferase [Cyclobacteriaceae bacterium]|nr:GNAT family N-acetyltransferase [Cyclobacteriaceae bacterium]MCH8516040.1 GNAT family N-acetyltransferase [Cyclobacteriaceae bacterium]
MKKIKVEQFDFSNEKLREIAFNIRQEVFVKEQKVDPEDEYDEYEENSRHFLAWDEDSNALGTARWRTTNKGVKLERFAVNYDARSMGVGSALVQAVLDDIAKHNEQSRKIKYLHGQLSAVGLYEKFGFEKIGEPFDECGIMHFLMEKQ